MLRSIAKLRRTPQIWRLPNDEQENPQRRLQEPAQTRAVQEGQIWQSPWSSPKRDDLNTVLQRVLNRKVRVKEDERKMPIRDALIWKLRELAMQGDKQAHALQRWNLTKAGHEEPERESQADRSRLFKEIGERLKHEIGQQGISDEG